MIIISLTIALIAVAAIAYLQHPKFGKSPQGNRLERIKKSPNFKNGQFQNIHFTPTVSEGYSFVKVAFDFVFKNFPRTKPVDRIPSVKTDLKQLPLDQNVLIWFGHSSYYMQLDGKRFLIDPVFSGNASPIPNSNKSFSGSDVYTADDMPNIDFLFISHDHYDHLDYETIQQLKAKIDAVVCGLGVGAHFEHWGYAPDKIHELDWFETLPLTDSMTIHATPGRHFSGRSFKRNNTLWLSFVLESKGLRLFLGGDSGHDTHFEEIGEKYGPFDLALLENGQYNLAWHEIHMLPNEVLQAAKSLRARRLMPVHSSKFKLGIHPWDEPLAEITKLNTDSAVNIITPKIGEPVFLNDETQEFDHWWEGVN